MKITLKSSNVIVTLMVAACSLHVLRNLSNFYFVLYGLVILIAWLMFYSYQGEKKSPINLAISVLWIYAALLSIITYLTSDIKIESPLIGIQRLFFTLPVLLIITSYSSFVNNLIVYKVALFFGIIGALSIPYQISFGTIEWLAEPGERAGLVRHTTILGSLTTYGALVGAYILATLYLVKNNIKSFLIITILIVGAIYSLQKAAILSISLAFIFAYILNLIDIRKIIFLIVVIAIVGIILYSIIDYEYLTGFQLFFQNMFGLGDASKYSDVTMTESINSRLSELPAELVKLWGLSHMLLGIGVYGAAGGLGYPGLPHPHNLVIELFSMFGVLSFFIFLLSIRFVISAVKVIVRRENKCSFEAFNLGMILLTVLPAILSGGLIYHPVSGIIFFNALTSFYKFKKSQRALSFPLQQ